MTPQGTGLGKAQTGSLWLCYAKLLSGKQKNWISGSWRSQLLGRGTVGKVRRGRASDRTKERYTDLRELSMPPAMPQPC